MIQIQPEQISKYIVESSNEGVWIIDVEMKTQFVNARLSEMLGYSPEEMENTRLIEYIFEEDKSKILKSLERRQKGIREDFDFRYRRKDGSELWAHVSGNPLFDDAGKYIGAVGMFSDISERKEYEKRLEKSEERYRAFIEQSSEGIWRFEIETPIATHLTADEQIELMYKFAYLAECNDAMARQYGFDSAEDLEGAKLSELFVADDPKNYEFLKAFIDSGYRLTEAESHEKDKQGNDKYFLNNFVGFVENGYLVRAWGTQRDITQRRRAEKATAYLAAIVETSDDAIISKDLQGIITSWNKSAEKMFGYAASEIVGKSILELIPKRLAGEEPLILERIRNGERVELYETVRRRRDGAEIEVSLSVSPIKDERGRVIGASKIARDITEKKQTERILLENQMMLSLAMQSSRMGAWERDIKTGIVRWSEELEEIFGLEKGSFTNNRASFYELIHQDERDKIFNEVETAIKEHRDYTIEFRFYHPDGKVHWMEGRGQAFYSQSGEPIRLYGIGVDITDRKKAEEQLRESEELYRTLFDLVPLAVYTCDETGVIQEFNRRAVELWGREPKRNDPEELYCGSFKVFYPDGRPMPHDECPMARVLRGEKIQENEAEILVEKPDGSRKNVIATPRTLKNDEGEIVGAINCLYDITEQKLAQKALMKAERKAAEDYQALLSRIVSLAQTVGTARDLLSIYRIVCKFVRDSMPCSAFFISFYNAQEHLRTAAYAWGDKGELDISALPPLKLTEDGGPNSQAVFQKKSVVINRYMDYMQKRTHVILQENGIDPQTSLVVPMIVMNRVVGTVEVQAYENDAFEREDIVALEMVANLAAAAIENVRILQIEAGAREVAEAANRAKDEFLSVLSHELRTPLNSMLGWVRMMRTGMLNEERTVHAIEVIERNTRLQNNLIEDLLDVSRIISGKMRIDKEEVDLVAIAQNSYETLRPVAESKNVSLEFSSEIDALNLEGDATRLHQIISNVIQNAIKFTPEGGKINVELKNAGSKARLIVEDTGIGIEKELLPYIFERFRQADASTRRIYNGLGLGLTIVSNLVELHGGNVRAESKGKGQGATFIIELPIARKYSDENGDNGDGSSILQNSSDLNGARILLVDDDAESIVPLQMLLEREKAEVVTVYSADEALAKLTEQTFHVLISDIGMPEMDGYDLIAGIRKLTSEQNAFLPAIALTAYAANEDRRRALSAGFQMHFSKPFDFDELLSAIVKIYKNSKDF